MLSQYSLKKRLILYISVFSIALGGLLIFSAYRIALEEINEVLDAQMKNLAERVAVHNPKPVESQFDQEQHYHEEDLFVDVWAYSSQQDKNHAINLLVQPMQKAGFYTQKTANDIWHTYVLPTTHYQIQISQQQSVRQRLALELASSMFIPYLLFMPFVIWGLSWIVRRSLQPLDDFKTELAQRDSHELKAIEVEPYPVEIVPSIVEINHLFQRISLAQQEQRQFIADAAHELRTPITALNLQMQILLKQNPASTDLVNLSKGLIRIQHLISQLLNLAKQDASIIELENKQPFLLNQVAVDCLEQLMDLALQKSIDLGMEQQQQVRIQSQASAVHSIIFNLIDNAIKYTPAHGIINVSVFQQAGFAIIQIEDSGPGIADDLHDKVIKRFYRVHHHLEVGSGLGLSIVAKATERLGGSLFFTQSNSLGGLQVNVQLPL
ncbi:sensor histidine kinase [Acinetobacter harbinensis]|uniref:sensor histidine kinase n=1 Tax=Acinetobacter harbinensis TaxID=1353941 RepID=UPI001C4FEA9B